VNIKAYSNRVGPDTEEVFNNTFYNSLNGVCNALDNVEARLYMDSQCILWKKPLLESGTLGTKGNTQVVVPGQTESYASSRDPPEKGIPVCTLHHFPNAIEHTIQWSRDVFEGLFKNQPESVNAFLTQPNFMESLEHQSSGVKLETLTNIKHLLLERPKSFEDCIIWARHKFEEYFTNNIQQLLYNFPKDMITNTGTPFWSGPKRAPAAFVFDSNNSECINFIIAAANLKAQIHGIKGERSNISLFKKILSNTIVPDFSPKQGVKISTDPEEKDKDKPAPEDDDDENLKKLQASIPPSTTFKGIKFFPIEFEKDDDTNFHIDFITAGANLRAWNYSIPQADKHKCKGIAGKIIPAMVTTTAVVSGLTCIELLKLIQGKKLDEFKNGFVNLALPFFAFSEPIAPPTTKVREGWTWTLWDRFDIEGEMTLQEFRKYFKDQYKLDVSMISCGASIIYSFFMNKEKLAERLNKKMSEVVQLVSKAELPPNRDYLTFEICCVRIEDDADVDVPYVRYQFKKV